MDYAKESLKMHYDLKGKIEVVSRAKVDSKDALSLAYTPGVAQPCLEIQKDVNVVDENGDGVLSITKTPFEITMKMQDPETKYVAVMLDANGDIMPYGGVANSNADTYAIQDRDVSTVYIYLCDYYEYMDELKGYYWSDNYEEKAKTRTFKQLLDERAVAGTEVHFDTDK